MPRSDPGPTYPFIESGGPEHVRDRNGVIWRVVRDGGMVTCADYTRIYCAGITWLESNYGPLEKIDPPPVPDCAHCKTNAQQRECFAEGKAWLCEGCGTITHGRVSGYQ